MSSPAIEVEHLARSFRTGGSQAPVHALTDVSFTVNEGQIVALLGGNGAGKTTLTKILSTLLSPTSGTARILGYDVTQHAPECRRQTSVIFGGDRGLYGRLTGRDNLHFFGMLAGLSRHDLKLRASAALERVGLADAAGRRVETYSKGMRQRLHIAIGFISEPKVLLLDEPTVGLDPTEAERLRNSIADLRDRGVSVLLTSHYLLDVEKLADRVLLLADGTIASDLSLTEFVRQAGYAAAVTVQGRGTPPTLHGLPDTMTVVDSNANDPWTITLRIKDWNPEVFLELGAIFSNTTVEDVAVREVRLDEAFAQLTGTHSR